MKLTKSNAQEIATKMSKELDGAVLFVGMHPLYPKVEHRLDKNGLNNAGWLEECAKQECLVKVTDIQIMWSTGHYSYSVSFHEENDICFPYPGIVSIATKAPSGNLIFWTFIRVS